MDEANVVVVGAGPSGAATALCLARRGHTVHIVDSARFPRDKACGEGLMPHGVAVLRRLGLLDAVLAAGARQLDGVMYQHMGEGPCAFAAFPPRGDRLPSWGLGVRRLWFDAVLTDALRSELGVTFSEEARAIGVRRDGGRVTGIKTDAGVITARIVIAADGLHSRIRAAMGWTSPWQRAGRYGVAGHWRVDTAARHGITVSFADECEWYQAPVGEKELLVSVLAGRRRMGTLARDYGAAARRALPALRSLDMTCAPLAAGQFVQRPRSIAAHGLFLVGDAAGYHDPTTGEGIAVGLELAEVVAAHVDDVLRARVTLEDASRSYARAHRALWRDRSRLIRLALFMARHPTLSHRAVARVAARPEVLAKLLGINCGYWGFGRLSARDWLTLAGV